MIGNLILSGGVAHDFISTSSILADVLSEVGIVSEIHEDFRVVEEGAIHRFDLLTLNCVRWTCAHTPQWKDEWGFQLSEKSKTGFLRFLEEGKGLLALHAATICFDDWREYRKILGAWWKWGSSGHAPLQEHRIRVNSGRHPIVQNVGDFNVFDELYTDPKITDEVDPLLEGEWAGKKHPVMWVRNYGKARVCYNALGHGPRAFGNPMVRLLFQRGALWVCGKG